MDTGTAAVEGEVSQLSIPLPKSLDTRIYIRLATQAKAILLSLTTASQDELAAPKPMGSFVYALPDVRHCRDAVCRGPPCANFPQRFNAQQPLSTTLFSHEPTVEFTTRLAKLIARRAGLPVYVTNSISFADAGMGGTVEEEMEALKSIVEVVLDRLREAGVVSK
ncbi:phytanoyl- dioxygenase family protein [Purpureocillium lavendulum]|uniref:Phytanoyl- dioxygenase family protein n=1 Tax=Purpureocillium lavendulum TaxID=1247861 RepID=A0AB34FSZ9_9HYPO|nr:phytanoyl- dioxygenase family protein [Purpureocillium lavendulum]